MDRFGHADSQMRRHYYHLRDEEARRRMNQLDFLGGAGGRSAGEDRDQPTEENFRPPDDSIDSSANCDCPSIDTVQ